MDQKSLLRKTHHCTLTFLLYEEPQADGHAYSVAVYDQNTQYAYATDVTESRSAAEQFLELICENGLEPCHLYDVLEDSLPLL